jgi:hypothetical protein
VKSKPRSGGGRGYGALALGKRERDLRNDFAHEVRYTARVVLDGLRHPRWLVGTWLRGGVPRFENWAEFAPKGASARQLTAWSARAAAPTCPGTTWPGCASAGGARS